MNSCVIIPAGGTGSRFGGRVPKQFVELIDKPVICHSIEIFDRIDSIDTIIIPINIHWKEMIEKYSYKKEIIFAKAGLERQDSVRYALHKAYSLHIDCILIHDAVRPCVSDSLIHKIIEATKAYGAAIPGILPKDTIKISNEDSLVNRTLQRTTLRAIQTPQGFRKDIILDAYQKATELGIYGTDDSYLVEQAGYPVKIIEGEDTNIKITTLDDLIFCKNILEKKSKSNK